MEAKDLAKKAKVTNPYYSGDHLVDCIVFTEEDFAIFWSQLCKEQREICYKEYLDVSQNDTDFGEFILNAHEPNIDD